MELDDLLIFILGASIGSFINVLVYRVPLHKSIVFTRSKCTKCEYQLAWFDNIPIISWFLLIGKCRKCKDNISISYPIIEFLTAFLFLLNLYSKPTFYQDSPLLFLRILGFMMIFICMSLSLFDLQYFWLPSFITFNGLLIGLISSLFISIIEGFNFNYFLSSLSAALLGFLIFLALRIFGEKVFNKPVLGKGDEKLVALLGSFLGVQGMLITIWLSFISAGIIILIGLLFKKIKRNQKIPFGIFISISGLMVWYLGNPFFLNFIFFKKFIIFLTHNCSIRSINNSFFDFTSY